MTGFKKLFSMVIAALLVSACSGTVYSAELTKDVVEQKPSKDGEEGKRTLGTIVEDDVSGVTVTARGARLTIRRPDVKRVIYCKSKWRFVDAMRQKFEEGDWKTIIEKIDVIIDKALSGLPNDQMALCKQHLLYYKGMAYFNRGMAQSDATARKSDLSVARDQFSTLLGIKKDTAWFFEVRLAACQVLEVVSPSMAAGEYKRALSDFRAKRNVAKWGRKYELIARMSVIRLQMAEYMKAPGREAQVKTTLGELLSLAESEEFKQYGDEEANALVNRIKSMAMLYLKQYEELSKLLSKAIADAYITDDQTTLEQLYVNRGDANLNLGKELMSKGDKKGAVKIFEQALVDFMMADFTFKLSNADGARVNYGIGYIFVQLKNSGNAWDDWQKKALRHLKKAKSLGSREAPALISTVESM